MISYKWLHNKTNLSTDGGLELTPLKLELLVIVGQHTTVNIQSRLYKPPVNGLEEIYELVIHLRPAPGRAPRAPPCDSYHHLTSRLL